MKILAFYKVDKKPDILQVGNGDTFVPLSPLYDISNLQGTYKKVYTHTCTAHTF